MADTSLIILCLWSVAGFVGFLITALQTGMFLNFNSAQMLFASFLCGPIIFAVVSFILVLGYIIKGVKFIFDKLGEL